MLGKPHRTHAPPRGRTAWPAGAGRRRASRPSGSSTVGRSHGNSFSRDTSQEARPGEALRFCPMLRRNLHGLNQYPGFEQHLKCQRRKLLQRWPIIGMIREHQLQIGIAVRSEIAARPGPKRDGTLDPQLRGGGEPGTREPRIRFLDRVLSLMSVSMRHPFRASVALRRDARPRTRRGPPGWSSGRCRSGIRAAG